MGWGAAYIDCVTIAHNVSFEGAAALTIVVVCPNVSIPGNAASFAHVARAHAPRQVPRALFMPAPWGGAFLLLVVTGHYSNKRQRNIFLGEGGKKEEKKSGEKEAARRPSLAAGESGVEESS